LVWGGWWWWWWVVCGELAQTMYTHVSKYKNDKIKGEKTPQNWFSLIMV
jgi:integral membrane sensor domain MASE1